MEWEVVSAHSLTGDLVPGGGCEGKPSPKPTALGFFHALSAEDETRCGNMSDKNGGNCGGVRRKRMRVVELMSARPEPSSTRR